MNAPADPSEPSTARVGGRYRLDERIGSGAMGVVWRGTDELLSRTVAVKELLAAIPSGTHNGDPMEEASQRLLREGRLGARLKQHPHVISVFDVVVHDNRPWLVMEYLPSRSLASVLAERGPLPAREVAEVGRQVADGLAAAHVAGVVHRDVKPGNVLLAEDGRVKLTDFGVSRAADDVQVTRTGMIAGTPAFLAPEVARGREPTAASDVFALGATLYAAVEGGPPFGLDDNPYALLHKVAMGVVDPPVQAGPLTNLLMRLLAPEPEHRPTAAQARDALAAVAAGTPAPLPDPGATAVLAPPRYAAPAPAPAYAASAGTPGRAGSPPTVTAPAVTPRRRVRPALLILLLGAVLVAGGFTAVLLDGSTLGGSPTVAPTPPAAPTTSSARPTDSPGSTTPPTTAPAVEDPVDVVERYYGFLPDDTDAAFAMLSPRAQAKSGGPDRFDGFWDGIEDVSVQDSDADGDLVTATVVFDPKDGGEQSERYRLRVGTDADGNEIIEDYDRVG